MAQQQLVRHVVTYKGKEYEVLDKPEEDLECRICLGLACDPCQTSCCGQTLCAECERNLPPPKSCPYCRERYFRTTRDARIERKIRSLTAYCPNYDDECNWLGSISKVNDHLEESCPKQVIDCPFAECPMRVTKKEMANHIATICPAQPMTCPNKCATGEKLTRSNFQYHLDIVCPEQVMVCQFAEAGCTVRVKRKDIRAHIKKCSVHPMTCPNHCAAKEKLTRSTLQDHLNNNCPEQVISCQFAEVGCTVKVKRREMAKHIRKCSVHPMRCPNHCATGEKLMRSTLQDHLNNNCPEEVIFCQFADSKTRCTVRVKRKDMAKHMVAHMSLTQRFLTFLSRFCKYTVHLFVSFVLFTFAKYNTLDYSYCKRFYNYIVHIFNRFVFFTFRCIRPLVNYIGITNNNIIMIITIIIISIIIAFAYVLLPLSAYVVLLCVFIWCY